jgi:hypothetical protein
MRNSGCVTRTVVPRAARQVFLLLLARLLLLLFARNADDIGTSAVRCGARPRH